MPGMDGGNTTFENHIALTRFAFIPAPWLAKFGLSYAVDFAISRTAHAGWRIALNTPRVLPDDSPIFTLCKAGDTEGVKQLLASGKASVLDVDSRGSTPLHLAASRHYPVLCQLLIDQNADVHAQDWHSWRQSPFSRACCDLGVKLDYVDDSATESRQIQTFRKLLAAGFDAEETEQDQQILRITTFRNREALERHGQSPYFEFPSQVSICAKHEFAQVRSKLTEGFSVDPEAVAANDPTRSSSLRHGVLGMETL